MSEHIAIYAGSFDPITSGHLDVIARARGMFDRIIVGIGHNPDKQALFPFDERLSMAHTLVEELVQKDSSLAPVSVEQYSGLTVDFEKTRVLLRFFAVFVTSRIWRWKLNSLLQIGRSQIWKRYLLSPVKRTPLLLRV